MAALCTLPFIFSKQTGLFTLQKKKAGVTRFSNAQPFMLVRFNPPHIDGTGLHI